MAKYDREFLNSYLRNLCALYFARRKLTQRIEELKSRVNKLGQGKPMYQPSYPSDEPVITAGRVLSILVGAFLLFCGLGSIVQMLSGELSSSGGLYFVMLIVSALGGIMVGAPIKSMKDSKDNNEWRHRDYARKLETDRKTEAENRKAREKIPVINAEIHRYQEECKKISGLIDEVYRANVIPMRYRDIYAAVYLYDYFANSREDDLAIALNTYVLEQVKDRLDIIIAKQSEMILNQCMMMANQQQMMQQQREQTAMMEAKLNQIAASAEERNQYLAMIESNTATAAYFATAEYIRRI